jgi:succinoglycan biosynthesis transport protein ExoP
VTAAQYLHVFARYRLLVAVCVLAGLTVAIVVTAMSGTTFTSVARVQVVSNAIVENNTTDAYASGLLAQQRVYSYADLANGTELTTRVLADPSLQLSSHQLEDRVRVSAALGSTVLTVVVHDSNADRTRLITSRVTMAVIDMVKDEEDVPSTQRPLLRAKVISEPSRPVATTTPPAWRNPLLGAAAGLVFGLAAAVVASRLDRRLHDETTVRQLLDAPVLGVFSQPGLFDPFDDDGRAVVGDIRSAIMAPHPRPGRCMTIAATTPRPDNRPRQVVAAVAASLADTGAQVLLIDADLRDPHDTPLLGSPMGESPGLADCLAGTITTEDIRSQHSPSGCYVVPAGRTDSDPADLLHSAALRRILLDAQNHYDLVLVMAPALSAGTGAQAVAALCDQTLLTVALSGSTRPELESALRHLQLVNANIIGAVVLP